VTPTHAGFIDAAFLKAEGARAVGIPYYRLSPSAARVMAWLEGLGNGREFVSRLGRVYWYDAAWDAGHPKARGQEGYYRAIERTPRVVLRLGRVAYRNPRWQTHLKAVLVHHGVDLDAFERDFPMSGEPVQKGVDVMLAVDLVVQAIARSYDTFVLFSGDGDLVPAVERVRQEGRSVTLAYPRGRRPAVSEDLRRSADQIIELPRQAVEKLFVVRDEDAARRAPSELLMRARPG
jgi:uncharacterized LabA/DUF88 family protein